MTKKTEPIWSCIPVKTNNINVIIICAHGREEDAQPGFSTATCTAHKHTLANVSAQHVPAGKTKNTTK